MRSLTFLRTLGAGAIGTVYLAELTSGKDFRRQVAVKVLQQHHPDSEMFLSRMRDEARLLGLLRDDSILKVLDMVSVDGHDAVVMEYVEGADLESVVRLGHPPTPRALAELGAAVAGALSRAHSARHPADDQPLNVVHRDVKPANVMVTNGGSVKLLDFGVARARFDARESVTGQLVLGTLNYIAPEYVVTGQVSPAADVYGLGLTLWEVAAGEVYGSPKLRQDVHERRLADRMDRIRATHTELVPVLEKMLAWFPHDRPTAQEVERQLLQAADDLRGSGLRSWANEAVPTALAQRKPAADPGNLVGRSVKIGTASISDGRIVDPPTRVLKPTPELLADPTVASRQSAESPNPPTGRSVTPRAGQALPRRPRPPQGPSLLSLVVKGALIGALFGVIVIIGMLFLLLLYFS